MNEEEIIEDFHNMVAFMAAIIAMPQDLDCLDLAIRASIKRFEDEELLKFLVVNRDYNAIIENLQSHGEEAANQPLDLRSARMTGLEYAIFNEDWRIAAIFISFGADPIHNVFEGVVQTVSSQVGVTDPISVEGFGDGRAKSDFHGLELLICEHDESGMAYLWIMQFLLRRNQSLSVQRNFAGLLENIEIVRDYLQFSSIDCKDLVWSTLLSMRRLGLPNEIAMRIAEDVVFDTLWHSISEYGLTGDESDDWD